MAFKELKAGQDIPREYLMHLVNATPGEETPTWVLLGEDLEELKMELSATVNKTKNILNHTKIRLVDYEATDSVDPYYAVKGDKLYDWLENIVRNRLTLDDCKTQVLTVYVYKGATDPYEADMESCVIEPKSFGGDTNGISIPFDIHREGDVTKGTYNTSTKTFTKAEK